jgi:hypothetical protein
MAGKPPRRTARASDFGLFEHPLAKLRPLFEGKLDPHGVETSEQREARLELEEVCGAFGRGLAGTLPEGVGFALLMFDFEGEDGSPGHMAYFSNAQREGMIAALREMIVKLGGASS